MVYDNRIWVMGGLIGGFLWANNAKDVWYSTDGTTWIQATPTASWEIRSGHTSVVFNNWMWVMGGYTSSSPNYLRDVYSSSSNF